MTWLFAILIVLAMGAIAAVAVGRGEPMVTEHADLPDVGVPESGPLSSADMRTVRFPLVLRGYRMADVDALLDRLAAQLEPAQPEPARLEPTPSEPAAQDDA